MNSLNSHKTPLMEEVKLQITGEDGVTREEVFEVPTTIKQYLEATLMELYESNQAEEYWRSLFEMHIARGVMTN